MDETIRESTRMIVVIPTARAISLEYLRPLIEHGARFIVVDDSPGSIRIDHPQFETYTWRDQERRLGRDAIAIPRRNGACRDFGFYIAWHESDDGEIVVALDDDEEIESNDFAQRVIDTLSAAPRPVARGLGTHFNVLDCYADVDENLFPRGFPYSQRADYEQWKFGSPSPGAPAFNLGLWRGVFDVNGIDKIHGPPYRHPEARLKHESILVPEGALISVCSGNMQFRREVIPAVYQLPMHIEVMPGWVIDRYGDIWGGFILKTLMDLAGDRMAVGGPMIRHVKEGSHERNVWQEHIGHLLTDEFLDLIALARAEIHPGDYPSMMAHMSEILERGNEHCGTLLRRYLEVLVPAMQAWTRLLS